MDFIHQVNSTVVLAEFIFCIYKNQSTFSSDFCTALEEGQCIFFKDRIFFRSSQSLFQNLFFGDIFVMQSHFGFRGRSHDRFREFLVFTHSVRKFHTAYFAYATFISAPCTSTKVTAYNHFHRETFAKHTYRNHWVRGSKFPIRTDVCCCVEEFGCNLVQHLSFIRNTFRQYYIKGRNTVGSYHD